MTERKTYPETGPLVDIPAATTAAARAVMERIQRGNIGNLPVTAWKDELDGVAVEAIRRALSRSQYGYRIIDCEGGNTNSPAFLSGEVLGNPKQPKFDLVIDPLDGTSAAAKGEGTATSLMLTAPKDTIYRPRGFGFNGFCARGLEQIGDPFTLGVVEFIHALSEVQHLPVNELVIALLKRPFQAELALQIAETGATVMEIPGAAELIGVIGASYKPNVPYKVTPVGTKFSPPRINALVGALGAPETMIMARVVRTWGSGIAVKEQDAITKEPIGSTLYGKDLVGQDGLVSVASILNNPILPGIDHGLGDAYNVPQLLVY